MASSSVLISVRIPHTFFPERTMSLGHLIWGSSPQTLRIPAVTASAAVSVSIDARDGSSSGRSTRLIQMPVPGGDDQLLPRLPLPDSWHSAAARVPSAAPCSASSLARQLVESVFS